jgi:hypothetical protein
MRLKFLSTMVNADEIMAQGYALRAGTRRIVEGRLGEKPRFAERTADRVNADVVKGHELFFCPPRAASTGWNVPTTFVCTKVSGLRMLRSTSLSAARCTTRSSAARHECLLAAHLSILGTAREPGLEAIRRRSTPGATTAFARLPLCFRALPCRIVL